jgi:hypothetical protein
VALAFQPVPGLVKVAGCLITASIKGILFIPSPLMGERVRVKGKKSLFHSLKS